ncbi:RILP-like protein 2 [Nibea albiflora]|uniref:RILP-like protein 2 n=1 Tax=Nibea albiflora TaxID=240163 RepID=A0ACB7FDT6_NIBAL|nr:RILP-like protein 2 [Nibea albiflora]
MEFGEESSPALAFDKEAFELTVEDVYDISYVIGRDLLKISSTGEEVSDLQFRIVRVLEMFETLVNKYNLSLEELKMERDNLKSELDRIIKEGSSAQGTQTAGPNQLVVDLTDPNRPRFTMQELKEVLQERNQLKAQLMVAQEELQLYKRVKPPMVEVDLETPENSPATITEAKEEKTTIGKL